MNSESSTARRWIERLTRHGRFQTTAVITIGVATIANILVFCGHWLAGNEYQLLYLINATVVPLLIMPPLINAAITLILELQRHAQRAEELGNRETAILNASLDALISMDENGNVIEFGPAAETMTGYSRAEAMGRSVAEIVIPPRLRDAHHDGLITYLAGGPGPVINQRIEVPAIRRNGEEFPCELTVVPVQLPNGKQSFTAFIRDISERVSQQEQIESAMHAAEQASEAKSRFLAHMTHEIRSPLHSVLGALDLLRNSELNDAQSIYARTGQQSCVSLLNIIDDILDFSKIEAGALQLEQQEFNLPELCNETLEVIALRLGDKPIELVSVITATVPEQVSGDALRLRQILINLLDNAIKFTDTGGVKLHIDAQADGDNVLLKIEVSDTGIGIPADAIDSLFKEFSQVDNSDTTQYGGTGLGLAIVKRLLNLMDGNIELSSDRHGTRQLITLSLPTSSSAIAPTPAAPARELIIISPSSILREALQLQAQDLGATSHIFETLQQYEAQPIAGCAVLIDEPVWRAAGVPPPGAADNCYPLYRPFDTESVNQLALSGATDSIAKPVSRQSLARLLFDSATSATTAPGRSQSDNSCRGQILLVEDSPPNQLITTAMLESEGYDVIIANDGIESIAAVVNDAFDIILMDLRMPKMNGIEATRKIRALTSAASGTAIIGMSANTREEDIAECLSAGMNDYITKPVEKKALLAKISQFLDPENT